MAREDLQKPCETRVPNLPASLTVRAGAESGWMLTIAVGQAQIADSWAQLQLARPAQGSLRGCAAELF